MCGITGLINWGNTESLARMTRAQSHRGPDDEGMWEHRTAEGGYIGLGNRRLAIIDLSSAGHMPMPNGDGSVWITYNGEIYNFSELRNELTGKGYSFRSNTDTEVILHLYEEEGSDCVKRLSGMFAFAIYDLRSGTCLLARDHFGIKPLYYICQGERIAFASEVKALAELPEFRAEIDLESLHKYLTFLWVPDPETMFRGVFKLPAGHYAIYKDGSLNVTRYWDLTFPPDGYEYRLSEAQLIDEVRERFRNSVKAHMVSDVPVGAFLSAGLDSSSIVAMMSQLTDEPVHTYTITFPSRDRVGESNLDDPRVAERVARHFNGDHKEIVVNPRIADLLPELTWQMDEPIADPAIVMAYLVCREASETVTVLLSGVGGDELFAGYRKHYAHQWARAYQRLPAAMRNGLIGPAVAGLPSLRGTPLKNSMRLAKKMARSASMSPQDAFLMNSTYMDETQKADLYTTDLNAELKDLDPWSKHRAYFEEVAHADFLNQMLYLDSKVFMASLNLTYNDKMSMASSVEVRVPFLDRELAEFVAWNVPPNLKLRGKLRPTTKYIFRKAMEDVLPKEVLHQPKAGFGAPIDYWLNRELREMVDDLLSESQVRRRGCFRPATVRRLIDEHRKGRRDWSMQIWQLLVFELWQQKFIDHSTSASA